MTNAGHEGREEHGETWRITVMPEGKVVSCPPEPGTGPKKSLRAALAEGGIFVDGACGGAGTCGKCKVRILSGTSSPMSDNERRLSGGGEGAGNCRLACRVIPLGDMVVEIPGSPKERAVFTRAAAYGTGPCGLAVDIGTTTVEAALIDTGTGMVIANRSEINPQTRFGMDVLSRISYVMGHPHGVSTLQEAIVNSIDAMTGDLCRAAGVRASSIGAVAVAGNCAMLHLLLGMDPTPLGAFPFTPAFVGGRDLPAAEVGLETVGKNARLYCLPSVSAFVGGDVVAGVYSSGLIRHKGDALLVDIGTNGEMVLSKGAALASRTLASCSCAAGPALEGMNIRCGMRASAGAIEDIFIDEDGSVRLKIVGGATPRGMVPRGVVPVGICGSGVLAAIKEFLRVGLVRSDGSLVAPEELPFRRRRLAALYREEGEEKEGGHLSIGLSGDVVITQKDIRQVQLAKGALLSGVCALLDWAGLQAGDIDKVFVAGQFGAHLPAENLTACGVLPAEFGEKMEYIGNSSLSGARMALIVPSVREEMETLARSVASLELSAMPSYDELFMKCLEFPRNG